MLTYPFNFPKIEATFLERINRFVIKAKLKNKEILAYLPNPGRLWEILLKGAKLFLIKNKNPHKLHYTVLGCEKDSNFVLLHTHLTNEIIKNLIEKKKINFLKNYKIVKTEPKYQDTRFDLLLENEITKEKMILEIKTCTLFGKEIAMFPDAETKRGERHILKLIELTKNNLKAGILFVIMNPNIKYFLPAYHIDYNFTKALTKAKNEIEIKALALKWNKDFSYVKEVKEIKIPFDFIKKIKDKGAYLLILYLSEDKKIKIGKWGEKVFKKGYYVYVGSAMGNLTSRIKRHLRKNKKLKWHIDYLSIQAKSFKVIPIRTDQKIECKLAKDLEIISDSFIPNFGASDCNCKSHLFYFQENPLNLKKFQKLILDYRINYIKDLEKYVFTSDTN